MPAPASIAVGHGLRSGDVIDKLEKGRELGEQRPRGDRQSKPGAEPLRYGSMVLLSALWHWIVEPRIGSLVYLMGVLTSPFPRDALQPVTSGCA